MQNYSNDAAEEVHRWERNFEKLPLNHQAGPTPRTITTASRFLTRRNHWRRRG
jgi:hypothetical protein